MWNTRENKTTLDCKIGTKHFHKINFFILELSLLFRKIEWFDQSLESASQEMAGANES